MVYYTENIGFINRKIGVFYARVKITQFYVAVFDVEETASNTAGHARL